MMRLISPSGSTIVVPDEKGARLLGQGYVLTEQPASAPAPKSAPSKRRKSK